MRTYDSGLYDSELWSGETVGQQLGAARVARAQAEMAHAGYETGDGECEHRPPRL